MTRREIREHVFIMLFQSEFHEQVELTEQNQFYCDLYMQTAAEDEKAYISEASCPQNAGDVSCVDQGKKHRVGELITCLPNRVIVEITGESEDLLS